MQMTPVTSSNIKAVGYDGKTTTLRVRFNSGRTYQYKDVPHEVYTALIGAQSIGKYFLANIKDQYATEEL